MEKEINKTAWGNLDKNSRERNGKIIVNPKMLGGVYPLTNLAGSDFIGVYLGYHKLYEGETKKYLFAIRDQTGEYKLYTSAKRGLMVWHSDGDDGPEWPAGILVNFEGKANRINKKSIDDKFKETFDKYPQMIFPGEQN